MKISKTGKISLEKGEVRVGNFFFRDEGDNEHISVTDLHGCYKVRVLRRMPLGAWLSNIMAMGSEGEVTLKTWVAVMWSLLAVIPDDRFVHELVRSADDALRRHPDWYGYDPDADDAQAAREAEDMNALSAEIREKVRGDGGE